jgi:hypothetical protein
MLPEGENLTAEALSLAHLSNNLKFYCSSFVPFVFNSAWYLLHKKSLDDLPYQADYRNILPKQMQALMKSDPFRRWREIARGGR